MWRVPPDPIRAEICIGLGRVFEPEERFRARYIGYAPPVLPFAHETYGGLGSLADEDFRSDLCVFEE